MVVDGSAPPPRCAVASRSALCRGRWCAISCELLPDVLGRLTHTPPVA
jgi:hypothetical protein